MDDFADDVQGNRPDDAPGVLDKVKGAANSIFGAPDDPTEGQNTQEDIDDGTALGSGGFRGAPVARGALENEANSAERGLTD